MDCKGFVVGSKMESVSYMDWEHMDGVTGDGEFGKLDSHLDFDWDMPMENYDDETDFIGDWDPSKFGPIPSDMFTGFSEHLLSPPVTSIDIIPEQKLLPDYMEEASDSPQESVVFQTQSNSPENETSCSSSCSAENSPPLSYEAKFLARPRSKRARRSCINPWLRLVPFIMASKTKSNSLKNKKRMREDNEELENSTWQPVGNKKCSHCEVTKTPQWREGPMGPKTLCNACGVRYRSGRLLPEYRPAASPTFVPFLHSNSHKKVIAMRNKGIQHHRVRRTDENPIHLMVETTLPVSRNLLDFHY